MKITFPYMGTTLVYSKLIELLGHEAVSPPKPSQRTIDLGVKYSPEFACFPMKVIMGSYVEALENGAEVIITSGGHGPCRAGFYGEMHHRILQNLGYDVDILVFDSIKRDFKSFIYNVKKLKGDKSWQSVWKILKLTYKIAVQVDEFEIQLQTIRAYEISKGSCNKVWDKIQQIYKKVFTEKDLSEAKKESQKLIDNIPYKIVPEEKKIRIGIVGEIYVVMESSVNMKMEEVLGNYGCEVHRGHYLSGWIETHMIPKWFSRSREKEIEKKGEKYIEIKIGGHAKETMGHIVDYHEQGFDAIIHLMPFGCLPELVSQSIMPKLMEDTGIHVLTIALDEQAGIANNLTRIEAFLDLVRNSKEKKSSKVS
ncbi:MAG: CoA protein activase [Alkaliphilus sp.]|nr:CoA protein activase [Alkaliphilus sp.]